MGMNMVCVKACRAETSQDVYKTARATKGTVAPAQILTNFKLSSLFVF